MVGTLIKKFIFAFSLLIIQFNNCSYLTRLRTLGGITISNKFFGSSNFNSNLFGKTFPRQDLFNKHLFSFPTRNFSENSNSQNNQPNNQPNEKEKSEKEKQQNKPKSNSFSWKKFTPKNKTELFKRTMLLFSAGMLFDLYVNKKTPDQRFYQLREYLLFKIGSKESQENLAKKYCNRSYASAWQ